VNFKKYFFSDFVTINPVVRLKAGTEYSFIEMKDLNDGQRFAYPSATRKLTGGSRFEDGDTLFARITPCLENGKICQAKNLENGVGFGSTEFLIFRAKKGISDSNFVYYLSRWDEVRRFAELNMVGTSGRQRVPKDVFQNLELLLPDFPTQSRIASILSSLDDKIELNRRMNQTLEQMAEALFNHYFVDNIDPDNLPEGWRIGSLREISQQSKDSINPTKYETIFHQYSIPAFDNGQKPTFDAGNSILSNKFFVKSHSILFSKLNPRFPRIWLIGEIDEKVSICSTEFLVFVPSIQEHWTFIYLQLSQKEVIENLINKAGGTSGSHQRVKPDDILNLEIIIPSCDILKEFDRHTKSLLQKKIENLREINILTNTRDTLLPKLMSREIDVDALLKKEEQSIENLKTA